MKRIILTVDDTLLFRLDQKASETRMKRSPYVNQVLRKHLGLPSVFDKLEVKQ